MNKRPGLNKSQTPSISVFFGRQCGFQVKMWRFSFFFQFWFPRLDYCESASKQPWNALQCVFSKSNHKTFFFCLSRKPFFVNESLCCCCCAKVSLMYLYIEIGVPLVYYAFQLALPEGQNFQTFPLLDQWNQIQQEWDRSLIYEKKNWMGLFKRVRQSEIGERDEREGWRAKKLMNENNGRGRLNKQMNVRKN